jgi:hypothetical protein
MDDETLAATRRSLHGVAELVIAGPQYRLLDSIELRVRPGGLGGAVADVAVVGDELVGPGGRASLGGTCRSLAAALGLEVSGLDDVYREGSGVDPDEELVFDPEALALVLDWFGRGDAAMRLFSPDQTPVLWPEHFDVGIAQDGVNYGASPGDAHAAPYAYVGPWDAERLAALRAADGSYWNAAFGASRPAAELVDVDAIVGFFDEGRSRHG